MGGIARGFFETLGRQIQSDIDDDLASDEEEA